MPTCLPGVPPLQRTPGGDFGWLRKTYTLTIRGTTTTEWGQTHGHNIVAVDTVFAADTDNTTSPGGTFPGLSWPAPAATTRTAACGALRPATPPERTLGGKADPIIGSGSYNNSPIPAAGQAVGAYRLLRGLNDNTVPGVMFTGVGIAVAPSTYNRTEAATMTRVAYGASQSNTWGNWCASCHQDMHSSGNYVHPVDESLGSDVANIYNAYVASGDLTGVAASSFTSLVPFAENTGDIATLQAHAKNDNSVHERPGHQ